MEIPSGNVEQLVGRYRTVRQLAVDAAKHGPREATKFWAEARAIEDVAITLLGVEQWRRALGARGIDG